MRILHTMLRVTNLERSLAFYTEVLGMKLLRTSENAEYKYTLAFVGFSDETTITNSANAYKCPESALSSLQK